MSNRKPFNHRAGYVASRKNPLTDVHNVISIAAEQGIDADGKYITVCEKHREMVSSTSVPKARINMKDASEWCSGCQAIQAYHDTIKASIARQLAEQPIERDGDLHVISSGQCIWTVKERIDGEWVMLHERITQGRLEWLLRNRYYCYRGYGSYDGYYHKDESDWR